MKCVNRNEMDMRKFPSRTVSDSIILYDLKLWKRCVK